MKKKLETRRLIYLLIVIASILTIVGTISYAYFTAIVKQNPVSGGFTTATMKLRFADNDSGLSAKMKFGETVTKKFLIENTGTVEASLSIDFINLVNTYSNGSLTYRLTMSKTENGTYSEIIPKSNVPVSNSPIRHMVDSEISVPAGEAYYYNLEITLNLLDIDQNEDLDAIFHTYFGAGQISKYRYHKLSVDPNGGVWDTYSSTQEYLLMNNETKTINNPTKIGYTFVGWDITGNSSTLEENIFSMGIEDSSLVAKWTVNKYNLTIDPKGGSYSGDLSKSMEYGSSISVVNPTREGYTFTGWDVSGGILNGTTYTMSEAKDVTLTATWQINNYKYIVYHNKMNIDGVGYTRVDADTDEGESEYNSTVTPEVKTYTGFDSPSQKIITIKHEEVYPPILNKTDYNYDRHQHTLTIEPNGGTYTGQTACTMYYEETVTLTPPTKTGYNFTNWTNTSGTLNGNEFVMKDEDSTIMANYEAKTFSVTFNANGGTTPTASKIVTYDSTYGELPTPTYDGYNFIGWFTEGEIGTEVTKNTKVILGDNQTLYAHWKKLESVRTALIEKGNNTNITEYNSGNKKELFAFNHPTATQTSGWTEEERRDYRYIGNQPNNFIMFNDETWRIIGIFTVDTENGNREQLVKIMRNESVGSIAWDSFDTTNEWTKSLLYPFLNDNYYNTAESFVFTYDGPYAKSNVNVSKGLNEVARTQIEKVKWYLGGFNTENSLNGPNYYSVERGTATCVTTGNCSGQTRATNILQKVGLIYVSDYIYTFANGVDDTCFADGHNCKNGNANSSWMYRPSETRMITPDSNRSQGAFCWAGSWSAGMVYSISSNSPSEVMPTVYLKSTVKITSGDGSSSNPYQIS